MGGVRSMNETGHEADRRSEALADSIRQATQAARSGPALQATSGTKALGPSPELTQDLFGRDPGSAHHLFKIERPDGKQYAVSGEMKLSDPPQYVAYPLDANGKLTLNPGADPNNPATKYGTVRIPQAEVDAAVAAWNTARQAAASVQSGNLKANDTSGLSAMSGLARTSQPSAVRGG